MNLYTLIGNLTENTLWYRSRYWKYRGFFLRGVIQIWSDRDSNSDNEGLCFYSYTTNSKNCLFDTGWGSPRTIHFHSILHYFHGALAVTCV